MDLVERLGARLRDPSEVRRLCERARIVYERFLDDLELVRPALAIQMRQEYLQRAPRVPRHTAGQVALDLVKVLIPIERYSGEWADREVASELTQPLRDFLTHELGGETSPLH